MENETSLSSCGTLLRRYREQARPTEDELRLRRRAVATQVKGLAEEELSVRVTRKRGLTQEELVARSGLSVEGLRKIERDRVCPFDDTILALARALGVSNGEREALLAAAGRARAIRNSSGVGKMPQVADRALPPAHVPRLPIPLTSFVGRRDAVTQIISLLHRQPAAPADSRSAACRLLTLTGPGGCGKSRIALAVAERLQPVFAAGAYLVELASLPPTGTEVAPIEQAIAMALDITPRSRRLSLAALIGALHDKELVLVLDNLEHLVEACRAPVAALLRACPGLRIVATSREALGISGEWVWPVPPLSLPATDGPFLLTETGERSEAAALFTERAQARIPSLSLDVHTGTKVAAICRRLDGLPLAIELAVACLPTLSLSELEARLDDRFALLSRGNRAALPRQQTLRATMDWSYQFLPPPAATLLRRLAPFSGGWTLAAMASTCVDELLPEAVMLDALFILVERSLVQATPYALTWDSGVRYSLLETVRAYADVVLLEEEGLGQARILRCRHLAYYLQLAERPLDQSACIRDDTKSSVPVASRMPTQSEQPADTGIPANDDPAMHDEPTTAWLNTLVLEEDNVRVALGFAMAEPTCVEQGLRLAAALWPFWLWRGALREGRRWLTGALEASGTKTWRQATAETLEAHTVLYRAHAEALYGFGKLADQQGAPAQARAAFEEYAALERALGGS